MSLKKKKKKNPTKGPFFSFPQVHLRLADNLKICYRRIYHASHAVYDLTPVELPLTWLIWR